MGDEFGFHNLSTVYDICNYIWRPFCSSKYFNNEKHEFNRLDESLEKYEYSANKNRMSLSLLNVSQTLVIMTGITIMLTLSVFGIKNNTISVGGFVVINGNAMYDASSAKTTHFELHSSEEQELVYRILALAGITIQNPTLIQSGMGGVASIRTEEKQ